MKIDVSREPLLLPPVVDVTITLSREEAKELRDYLAERIGKPTKFKYYYAYSARDTLFDLLDGVVLDGVV